jgi:hypothetical protein
MTIMNQKLRYVGLIAFLVVAMLVPNYVQATSQKVDDAYAHPPITALFYPNLVCGDHVCGPHEVPHPPQAKK